MPLFLILAFLGVAAGGVLTGFEAAQEPVGTPRRRALPRARRAATGPRRGAPEPRTARPSLPPGSTSIRRLVTPPDVPKPAPTRVAAAVDPRLQGILVGMGFKVPETKEAIGKMPTTLAAAPLQDQLKGALALLSK